MYNCLDEICWEESNVILTDAFNTHIFGFSVSSSVSFIKVHVQQWQQQECQKSIGLATKTTTLYMQQTFLCISLSSLQDYAILIKSN